MRGLGCSQELFLSHYPPPSLLSSALIFVFIFSGPLLSSSVHHRPFFLFSPPLSSSPSWPLLTHPMLSLPPCCHVLPPTCPLATCPPSTLALCREAPTWRSTPGPANGREWQPGGTIWLQRLSPGLEAKPAALPESPGSQAEPRMVGGQGLSCVPSSSVASAASLHACDSPTSSDLWLSVGKSTQLTTRLSVPAGSVRTQDHTVRAEPGGAARPAGWPSGAALQDCLARRGRRRKRGSAGACETATETMARLRAQSPPIKVSRGWVAACCMHLGCALALVSGPGRARRGTGLSW